MNILLAIYIAGAIATAAFLLRHARPKIGVRQLPTLALVVALWPVAAVTGL